MNKEVLRSLFLDKRKTLTISEQNRRNQSLLQHVIQFLNTPKNNGNCHIFLSIEKFNEPNTWPIFEWLLKSTDHEAFLSKTNFKTKELSHYRVDRHTEIKKSKLDIPEPLGGIQVDLTILDIVFIPLICYDLMGNRIGYGAGIYDRFLSQLRPETKKIGLAITPPLDNIDYHSIHDIPIDLCINHLGIDFCQRP
ncbi:5-formyltetrahydrofolate cyclo-ligase [Roseivirga misakiensis]|uniref:5-formyltetrahydrofolate cyclo-ligase n=1 Tax=Roseivirga misakiensis TaxID=1563681 RepID=A0A1E5T4W6_9BACT|nr:5-formyltetrahydrofolate cyclo-ligase [Roseivirga misakiensis]OEK06401.1 5-formyltetrahydrofolate cyclo-ligase [Roseivirga misakiensis]